MKLYELIFKRLLDFFLSLLALVFFLPLIIILAILVKINLGSPIIYSTSRPGKGEKLFKMYKFRSMSNEKDKNGNLKPDSERLPSFGRKLRATSLDELPELFNILIGDMSIIGPRPLAAQYLPYYTTKERLRHSVRPGLSGLAQVNGRNSVTWEERFEYDIKYVKNITFIGDIKILIKTISTALSKSNIGERGKDGLIDFDEYRRDTEKE